LLPGGSYFRLNALSGILFFKLYWRFIMSEIYDGDLSLNALSGILFFKLYWRFIMSEIYDGDLSLNALSGILFFKLWQPMWQVKEIFSVLMPFRAFCFLNHTLF